MYFSRISLKEDAQGSSDFWRVFRSPYTLHQSIWQMFSDYADRKRDFLYRLDQNGKRPLIYTVSVREPDKSMELWHIESKPYEPKIRAGIQLAFMLRANPICTKRDEQGKQHRHDVVMEAKTHLREQNGCKPYVPHRCGDEPPLATLVQEEGNKWLLARTEEKGFTVNSDHIRADGYQQHRFFKGKGNKPINFSTLEFNGILTVVSPESFVKTLYEGIGPAKSFGCGLMMVKKV